MPPTFPVFTTPIELSDLCSLTNLTRLGLATLCNRSTILEPVKALMKVSQTHPQFEFQSLKHHPLEPLNLRSLFSCLQFVMKALSSLQSVRLTLAELTEFFTQPHSTKFHDLFLMAQPGFLY